MGAHAYAVSNILVGYPATAFSWFTTYGSPSSGGFTPANRTFLNDRRMDEQVLVSASAASGVNVIIDVGGGGAVQPVAVAMLNSNCAVQKSDAALLVEASSNATFAADVNVAKAASTLYSSKTPWNKDHVLQWNANHTKRYWRFTWTWTGSVSNFSIGEIFIALATTQLARRSIYGSGERLDAVVSQVQMQYGGTRSGFRGGPVRQLDWQWDDLTASERDELYAMHTASSFGGLPLLFINSYEATATAAAASEQDCVFGRLIQPSYQFAEKDFRLYQPGGFSLRSEGREAGG